MTLLTPRTELAIVHIIGAVAGNAGIAQRSNLQPFWGFLLVATFARNLSVRALQPVLCLGIVIKRPDGPGSRVVTGFALHTELLFVGVILFMASKAFAHCILVTGCFVAALALNIDMPAR